jgi:hypothetical protein
MYTLFDFMTHVKGIEYIVSVLSIVLFMVFWEALKPRPFATVASAGREDLAHLRQTGGVMKYAGKIAAAPFIGLLYVAMLPIGFFFLVLSEVVNLAVKGVSTLMGRDLSFTWSPVEAYFTGRKRKQAASSDSAKQDKK